MMIIDYLSLHPLTIISFLFLVIFILIILVIWIYTGREQTARLLYQSWKREEFERLQKWLISEAETTAQSRAEVLFHEWQRKEEQRIRQDAVRRSHSVLKGKITEHLIPFFSEFPYNPSDARFLGSPVDFIVFDGLSDGKLERVVFVEVKTGSGTLTTRERSVARVVEDGRVQFQIIKR